MTNPTPLPRPLVSLARGLFGGALTLALWVAAPARVEATNGLACPVSSQLALYFPSSVDDILMISPGQWVGGHELDLGGGDVTLSLRFESSDLQVVITDTDPFSQTTATWTVGPNNSGTNDDPLILEIDHEYRILLERRPSFYGEAMTWDWLLPTDPIVVLGDPSGLTKAETILKPKEDCPPS